MTTAGRDLGSRGGARVIAFPDAEAASRHAADRVAGAIRGRRAEAGRVVLGLATGGTPAATYRGLVEIHEAGDLSFAGVTTYNLDEYHPIEPTDPNSYRRYMDRHLFSRVDIRPGSTHLLDGTVPEAGAAAECAEFDRRIGADGGIDLQVLGIGRNGHIGFNEPSDLAVEAALRLPTRRVALHPTTAADAAKDFGGEVARVPTHALTMGIAPILAARSILILAFGAAKAEAVARSLDGPMTAAVPGSLLRTVAGRVTWVLDEAAAAGL